MRATDREQKSHRFMPGCPQAPGSLPSGLVGWSRVKLDPGESKDVAVELDPLQAGPHIGESDSRAALVPILTQLRPVVIYADCEPAVRAKRGNSNRAALRAFRNPMESARFPFFGSDNRAYMIRSPREGPQSRDRHMPAIL